MENIINSANYSIKYCVTLATTKMLAGLNNITLALARVVNFLFESIFTQWKYDKKSLPEDVIKRYQDLDGPTPEANRVMRGLVGIKNKQKISENDLNIPGLKKLAQNTNASFIHYSANCELLAACLLRNLEDGELTIAAKNSFPFYKGLNPRAVDYVVFKRNLTKCMVVDSINKVEESVLKHFEKTGKRFYLIRARRYKIPFFGKKGHSFNAVVLFNENKPYVQFVDVWKTSNHTPQSQDVVNRYLAAPRCEILCT